MNTLRIEAKLAEKYKYKPLPSDLSIKYREYFKENIPEWLHEDGDDTVLYTSKGSQITSRYDRIVIGDYGAFIEFGKGRAGCPFIIAPGQEYRINDAQYRRNVKYIWMTIDDGSNIKVYLQKKRVAYADYIPGKYYVSVHEVFVERNDILSE